MRLALLALVCAATAACSAQRSPNISAPSLAMSHNAQDAAFGFTDGWQNGTTVTFFYQKPFFCAEPPSSAAATQCDVGEDGTVDP